MAVRESLAYSKDLITGKLKEITKYKPEGYPMRGVFSVELFDASTGKKTYEAKSENRITPVYANAAYLDAFCGRILNNSVDNVITNANGNTDNPCRCMLLTDGNVPEDLYDYWTFGNIIGYADLWTTYSGSDNLRGTINQSETTFIDNLQVNSKLIQSKTRHFVVDFPTNAANGTFSSIYLMGGAKTSFSAYYPGYYNLYTKIYLTLGGGTANAICIDDNNIYNYATTTSGSTTLYVIDKRTYMQKDNIVLPFPVYAMEYDKINETFWVALSSGAFKKYDKNFNLLNSYSKTSPYTLSGISDICVTDAYILISYRGASQNGTSNRAAITVYNKSDGIYNKTIDVASFTYSYISLSRLKAKGKIFVKVGDSSGTVVVLNESDLSVMSSNAGNIGSFTNSATFENYNYYLRWDDDTQLFIRINTTTGILYVSYLVPAFAHTLLASPVTKTSTNTMKIQYDLTVDYVYPLDMPAH
ncbi:phage-like protein [Clostridium pasteurianum DSM 525 = ATCC 6013]|uniref:Phage-like protein n=1 Tax=Clostridium pasteurianum DSM 525 = ATCC 6013 TaxID=1262449 RepID=A0A0H3JAE0_CLOPA|nr:hypothetical protein [Clostridium pasteurianum]AJA48480.1 phage-like protein [Clostridium pasteurianum DSM 525 = ATCC 6013]AJA52468.1 phage-like protein [Clostridium pasteurianum DSM 525 = ATCC 6013]AOZ75720.1 hypothetical protein AQ983_11710 [Clostridium pasteurianum DSM 525 = ATCC 6013]AOZ79516.1 hypothetical protein AQ984_11705 [Clostridium pasteurianum]ELP60373.1 phage-like protein [Clostridium pasteurianum DSM 525 = ATCC 6013]